MTKITSFLEKIGGKKNIEKEYFIFGVSGMEYRLDYDEIKYNTQPCKYTFQEFGKSKFKGGYTVKSYNYDFGDGLIIASWDLKSTYVEELITGIKIPLFIRKIDVFNKYFNHDEYPESPVYALIHAMYEGNKFIMYKLPNSKFPLQKATIEDIEKYIEKKEQAKLEESLTKMFTYYENAYYNLLKELKNTIIEKEKEELKIKKLVHNYKNSRKK